VIFDPRKFKAGAKVRIADLAVLEGFLRTWTGHHKLTRDQLQCAGQVAEVQEAAMYHGGDIIYLLQGIPGIWHEHLLEPASDST
jgi:hypothetical protein